MPEPRIIYIVTSYRDPEQLYRLVSSLRALSPNACIIVSHDRKSKPLDSARLATCDASWWPTPAPVLWGDGTYLISILAAFARLKPAKQDWITTLSAQDYPIRPLSDFEKHLLSSEADTLLEKTPNDEAEWHLRGRYVRRGYRVPARLNRGATGRLVNVIPGLRWAPMPHGLMPIVERRVLRPPYPLSKIRRGNDLYAVNGRAVQRLLSVPPRVLRHFERAPIPSEAFAHTVLMNDPSINVRPEMLHFARWQASAHPNYLSLGDLPEMLGSGRWFARKFLQDDPVLDRLDSLIAR